MTLVFLDDIKPVDMESENGHEYSLDMFLAYNTLDDKKYSRELLPVGINNFEIDIINLAFFTI